MIRAVYLKIVPWTPPRHDLFKCLVVLFIFQLPQSLRGVHVRELLLCDLDRQKTLRMRADDGITTEILRQLQQLREELLREEIRIAALAVVGRAHNAVGMRQLCLHDLRHAGRGLKRLGGHHI